MKESTRHFRYTCVLDEIPIRTVAQTISAHTTSSLAMHQGDAGIRTINQESDTTGALRELNDDTIDASTRMSGIDLRTILHPLEIAPLARIDMLVAMRFLPITVLHLSRQKKRLNASLRGIRAQQIVDLAAGKRSNDLQQNAQGSVMEKLKGMIGMSK